MSWYTQKIMKFKNKFTKKIDLKQPEFYVGDCLKTFETWLAESNARSNEIENYKSMPMPKTQKEVQELISAIENRIPYDDGSLHSYLAYNDSGAFFTYCLNKLCEDYSVEITKPFGCLAIDNASKNWIIHGNAGGNLGSRMQGGEITVYGNIGKYCAHEMKGGKLLIEGNADEQLGGAMEGGEIVLKGDAGYGLGTHMRGGKITVLGNVKGRIGINMGGGEIHLNGNFKLDEDILDPNKRLRTDGPEIAALYRILFGGVTGGDIYYKEKLIVKDGRLIEDAYKEAKREAEA